MEHHGTQTRLPGAEDRSTLQRRWFFRLLRRLLIAFLLGIPPSAGQAVEDAAPLSVLKTLYVVNFLKFLEWTGHVPDVVTIVIVGRDPEAHLLDQNLEGTIVDGRRIHVHRTNTMQPLDDEVLLYVGEDHALQLHEILTATDKSSVLTVSALPRFCEQGGMIQLFTVGKKLRFHIDETQVARHHLHLSSRLLSLSTPLDSATNTSPR